MRGEVTTGMDGFDRLDEKTFNGPGDFAELIGSILDFNLPQECFP